MMVTASIVVATVIAIAEQDVLPLNTTAPVCFALFCRINKKYQYITDGCDEYACTALEVDKD